MLRDWFEYVNAGINLSIP